MSAPSALSVLLSGEDDFCRRRRKRVESVAHSLREALKLDEISDHAIDQAIASLQTVQRSNYQWSNGAKQILAHKRSASDPNVPLTIWMRLRHCNKPERGYRVQCPDAISPVTPLGAIDASSFLPNVARGVSDGRLKGLVMDHLHGSRKGSPFISIFTDEARAEEWAMQWSEESGGKNCILLTLDPNKITRLFSVKELAQQLGFRTSAMRVREDEWLVVHQIPAEAIVGRREMRAKAAMSAELEDIEKCEKQPRRKDSVFREELPTRLDSLTFWERRNIKIAGR